MPTRAPILCLKLSSNVQIQWLRLSTLGIALKRTQFQLQVYLEKRVRIGTYCKIDKVNKKKTTFFWDFPFCTTSMLWYNVYKSSPLQSEFIKRRNNAVSNLIWLQSPLSFNIAVLSLYKGCLSFEIHAK